MHEIEQIRFKYADTEGVVTVYDKDVFVDWSGIGASLYSMDQWSPIAKVVRSLLHEYGYKQRLPRLLKTV